MQHPGRLAIKETGRVVVGLKSKGEVSETNGSGVLLKGGSEGHAAYLCAHVVRPCQIPQLC